MPKITQFERHKTVFLYKQMILKELRVEHLTYLRMVSSLVLRKLWKLDKKRTKEGKSGRHKNYLQHMNSI